MNEKLDSPLEEKTDPIEVDIEESKKDLDYDSLAMTVNNVDEKPKPKPKARTTVLSSEAEVSEKVVEESSSVAKKPAARAKKTSLLQTPVVATPPASPSRFAAVGTIKESSKKYWAEAKTVPRFFWIVLIVASLLAALIGFQVGRFVYDRNDNELRALTESELREAVADFGSPVYWAGPEANAKYTFEVIGESAAFIRYLPNGEGLLDTREIYLVIATYYVNNAYEAIRAAGEEQDSVGLINPNGAAIYYSKQSPTNVYMAYPNQAIQVEVFDPTPGRSIVIATSDGVIQPVR